MAIDPTELLGVSKAIDSIKSAFPAVTEKEPEIKQGLDRVQKFCDTKYRDVTGVDPEELKP